MVDEVQPEKMADRRRHVRESPLGVEPGASGVSAAVGKSPAIRVTWQAIIQKCVTEAATANMAKPAASAGAACKYHCRQSGKDLCVL
jgi:hypothetical protein